MKVSDQVGEQPSEQVSPPVTTPVQNGGLVSGLPSGKVGDKVSGLVSGLPLKLLMTMDGAMSTAEIQDRLEVASKRYVKEKLIRPLVGCELLGMEFPDTPNHPRQKYYLTEKGKAVLERIKPKGNL